MQIISSILSTATLSNYGRLFRSSEEVKGPNNATYATCFVESLLLHFDPCLQLTCRRFIFFLKTLLFVFLISASQSTYAVNQSGTLNVTLGNTVTYATPITWTSGDINLNGGTLEIFGDFLLNPGTNLNFNSGNLIVHGNFTYNGDISFNGNITIDNILDVTGIININVGATLKANGIIKSSGDLNVSGTLIVGTGDLKITGGNLNINTGALVVVNSNLTASGGIRDDSNLIVTGNINANGILNNSNTTYIFGTSTCSSTCPTLQTACDYSALATPPGLSYITSYTSANNTITRSSAPGTDTQVSCINSPITPIMYSTTGATGAEVTNLPTGVTGTWTPNVVTISGTPTVAGAALTYTVKLTGGCSTVITTSGSITVKSLPAASAGADRAICLNASTTLGAGAIAGNTYSWTSAPVGFASTAANPSVTPLITTTYSIVETITATGCTNTHSVVVTVNPTPTAIAPLTQSFCNGAAAVLSLTGTPSGVVFDITGGAAIGLNNIAGAAANPTFTASTNTATINITPRANGCTGAAVTPAITVSPMPTVTIAPPAQTICSKDPTAFAISSSSVGATFSWTVGAIVPAGSITGASSGSGTNINQVLTNTTAAIATVTYSIVATANGCAGSPVDVTVSVKPAPNLVVNNPNPVCAPSTVDLTAAAITAGSSGGLVLNYWQDAAATILYPTPSTAGNGTYYIGGFDAVSGCTAIYPVTVIVNIQPKPTLVITNPASVCSGTVDITLPAITSGSTAALALTYWMDAAATIPFPTPAIADADTYYIKGSSAFCSDLKPVTVTVASTLGIPVFALGASSNICKGSAPITYSATAANSSTLNYALDAASVTAGNAINSITGKVTFAPGWVGTSLVTATATGCGAPTQSIHTIKVNDPPAVALSASTLGPVCEGTPITLTAANSGGSTLKTISKSSGNINVSIPKSRTSWAGSILPISGFGTATIAATDIIDVNLNITHADVGQLDIFLVSPTGSCMLLSRNNGGSGNNYSATLRTNYTPNVNTLKLSNSTIAGFYGTEGNVSALAPQNGGFGGNYNNTAVPQSILLGAIIDGNWEVRVFDNNFLGNSGTLVNWSLTITKQIGTGFTTVVNGSPTIGPINYSGAFNTTATAVVTPPAGTNNYTVTTTDANGCFTTSNAVALVINPTPKPTITADYCLVSKKIHLTATGGGTYLWNTTQTTNTIDVDVAGIYSVTVTNGGCPATASINVANELVIDGSFTNFNAASPAFVTDYTKNQAYYSGGTTGLNPEGYYAVNTSAYSNYPGAPNGYHPSFHGRDHTNNTVGPRNFMMVNGSAVKIPDPPNPDRYKTIWQQTVPVLPNTDYYFSAWGMNLNPTSPAQLQFEVNGILVGTVADLNVASKPAVESDVALSNWVQFYSNPKWSSGAATTAIIRIRNLNIDPNGNDFGLDDISFGTLMASPATINPDIITSQCEGTSIDLKANVTGGIPPFTYAWTGPNGFTSSLENPTIPNATFANGGSYSLTFSDGYGCATINKTFNITIKPAATVNAGPDQTVFVSAPSVTLAGGFGGAAVSGTWSGGTGSYNPDNQTMNAVYTPSAAEIAAGSATLTLTTSDPGSPCSPAIDQVKINIYPNVTAQITASARPLCISGSTGSATASATGGTAPYSYSWNTTPVKTTAIATNLPAGTYTVTITDAHNSTDTKSVTLIDPPQLVVDNNVLITKPGCFGATNGKAEVIVISGDPPTYLWSNGQTTNPATGLTAGNYTVKATWANGCAATNINVSVTQPAAPTIACPADVTIQADAGFTYASNVTVPAPVYTNDCPMVTQTWEMTGVTTANSPLTGINPINPRNFDIGVTNIKYTIIDGAGNSCTCTFKVTVEQQIGPTIFSAGVTSFCQNAPDETYIASATNSTSIAYSVLPATAGVINSATGVMNWDAAFSGNAFITANATGPSGTTNATQTVTVTPTVGTPVFALGTSSARDQGVGPFTYTATATNSTAITYSLDDASLAGGNTINSSTGVVTYTALWSWKSIITATATGCNGPKTATHVVGVNWCYALFTANGALSCAGASTITGDVGTFVGATTGFTGPGTLVPPGHIDAEATPASAQAAAQTVAVYNDLAVIPCGINPAGITLAGPTTLTPNVYCYGGALTISGDVTLDGLGNPNAVFIFKINGALTTNTLSKIILTGGADFRNVYWRVYGAVVLSGLDFKGTIVNEGAFTVNTGAALEGRALSINGAIAITDNAITSDCYPLFSVPDNTKPIFVPPANISECVENLSNVEYNPLTTVINPDRPDYYTFLHGDTRLDLNTSLFSDDEPLTCPSNIRWQIDFSPASDFNSPYNLVTQPPITGFGKPSEHIGNILFPGDGVNFNPVVHHITWWIKDCAGNESPPQTRSIKINPRPKIQ